MKFAVHDIEKPPTEHFLNQHIVIASNAVHATHSLTKSGENIRTVLRPDGFLMMLEMTAIVPFIDIIFGLLEGWWLFDDGWHHAIAPCPDGRGIYSQSGLDMSTGWMAACRRMTYTKSLLRLRLGRRTSACRSRRSSCPRMRRRMWWLEKQMWQGTWKNIREDFAASVKSSSNVDARGPSEQCVFLTGATGSLGSHLVAQFAELSDVQSVVCVNQRSSTDVETRQQEAVSSRASCWTQGRS